MGEGSGRQGRRAATAAAKDGKAAKNEVTMTTSRGKRPARRRATPRGTLNPEVIVKAAIKVIDDDGLTALTTVRLAKELDVRPMALYTHFRDKDAILRAVAVELLGRFELPESTADPIESLCRLMTAYFRLLVDNPALLQLDTFTVDIESAEPRFGEALYACMRRLRLDHRTAVTSVSVMFRHAVGCAVVYRTRRVWDDDPDHWPRHRRSLAALPPETYPSLHELAADFPAITQKEYFDQGLDVHLSALAAAAAAGASP
jgi:AcrR family transcriptional regulator